jgi:hypothetical protein
MESNDLRLETIYDLLGMNFFIPGYQRGYRWDRKQVKNLLDDLWEFKAKCSGNDFYCLQPIVLNLMSKDDKRSHQILEEEVWYEVIDGQQRLTTIRIILFYLVKEHLRRPLKEAFSENEFSIKYETRQNIQSFLEDIKPCSDTVDSFHISEALDEVKKWFSEVLKNNYNETNSFMNVFLGKEDKDNPVKVIRYEISENVKQVDVFSRLNIGKIPLTNAELIKALFLNSNNFSESKDVDLKQIQIATEWDRIEQTLQNDSFWYFIYQGKKKYATRIEYLFDLKKNNNEENEYFYTFYEFIKEFNSNKLENGNPNIDGIWLGLNKYFLIFEEWFYDNELYHLIGYLIANSYDIKEIISLSKLDSKIEFKSELRKIIKNQVHCDLDSLEYNDVKIRKILLLFNLETLIQSQSNVRFPFNLYLKQNWDIEHIRSQTDKLIKREDRKPWAMDLLEHFTEETDIKRQKTFIENDDSNRKILLSSLLEIVQSEHINENRFAEVYNDASKEFNEGDDFINKHGISNLALLDASTNRSYGNAFFPVKRSIIIKKDMNGLFVPLCTKNVFIKSYSSRSILDNISWTQSDADDYLKAIKKTLKTYLTYKDIEE